MERQDVVDGEHGCSHLGVKRLDDFACSGCDARRADNRCDSGEDPTDPLGIDIEIARHSKGHQIRKGRGINCDKRSNANEHEPFGSRLDAAESAVMSANRSRTEVSLVESAVVLSFVGRLSSGPFSGCPTEARKPSHHPNWVNRRMFRTVWQRLGASRPDLRSWLSAPTSNP